MGQKLSSKFKVAAKVIEVEKTGKNAALASLKKLIEVFNNQELKDKIDANPNLLFCISNLLLLDQANLNGDAVRKSDVLSIYKQFRLQFVDVEHDRKEVIGSIYDSGFCLYPSDTVIDEATAAATEQVTQLYILFYLWRLIAPNLVDYVESASYEDSPSYNTVSISFELMFDTYEIALGKGGDPRIENATLIDPSDKDYKVYDKILKCNGGTGFMSNGDIVFRILGGEIIAAGIGVVTEPASGLLGILAVPTVKAIPEQEQVAMPATDQQIIDNEKKTGIFPYIGVSNDSAEPSLEKTQLEETVAKSNNNKNLLENRVNDTETLKTMDIKTLEDLTKNWGEVKKLETAASIEKFVKEHAEASAKDQIADAIAKKSEEWAKESQAKDDIVKLAEANKAELETKIAAAAVNSTELQGQIDALKAQLDDMKKAHKTAKAGEKFNERMAKLNDHFQLSDEDNACMGEDVKDMSGEDDAAFNKYFDKQKTLMKEKSKAYLAAKQTQLDQAAQMAKAALTTEAAKKEVESQVALAALASAKEVAGQEIPNGGASSESLKEMYKSVFGEGVTVKGVKAKDLKKKEC